MPVTTQLQIRSLARDPSGQLASQGGMLRRAENIVIRAPGIAESRPNFDLYIEKAAGTALRIKALREFEGAPLAIEQRSDTLAWAIRSLAGDTVFAPPVPGGVSQAPEPVDYDTTEPRFAEARGALYFGSKRGMLRIVNSTNYSTGLDVAGVEPPCVSDWLTQSPNYSTQDYSWAYCAVYVRKDPTGYGSVRRGPPSERWVVTKATASRVRPPSATRFYFSDRLRAGDQVEFYRSREASGDAPSAEMFLTFAHTITSADISAGYFAVSYDEKDDDELGATLYTSPSQGGALAARYAPPRAQVLAWFAGVMWYGRATQPGRIAMTLRSTGLGGPVRGYVGLPSTGVFTAGSAVVTGISSTASFRAGENVSDNTIFGSTVAGVKIPALTTILTIDSPTQITMSANALASGTVVFGMMSRYAPSGIATGVGDGTGTHTLGSAIVTAITSTANMRAGMGWTDSANGPAVIGTRTSADTRILTVDSSTQVTLTKVALSNGTGAYAYDCIEIATFPFYAWPGTALLSAFTPVWSWPLRTFLVWPESYGLATMASVVTSLALAVNYLSTRSGSSFRVRANVIGDTNLDDKVVTNFARSIVFEESNGIGGGMVTFSTGAIFTTPFTIVPSRPTAFESNETTYTADIVDKPNRLYWSEPDEPEAVRLTSYVDIGQTQFPILALVPLTNCLLVFTSRGVYRVTGSAPNAWAVECLDDKLRLMRPEAVTAVNDVAYAWCDQGFFAVDQTGARSISAGALDVELHTLTQYLFGSAAHGTFVAAWPARQIVLFGTPGALTATKTSKIYAYSLITQAFSEWPLEWGVVAESKADNFYHSRAVDSIVLYEVRSGRNSINGYDRSYTLSAIVSLSTVTLTLAVSVAAQWEPAIGDMVAAVVSGTRYFRRITAVATVGSDYVLTLEEALPSGSPTTWKAYEVAACKLVMEWHPSSPAGIPVGAFCRELQVQVDLRLAPTDADKLVSIPKYDVGGTSERDTAATLITSNRTRVAQIQPIRVGTSRQIARAASIAPRFDSSDIFCMRVNGLSMVWEGVSERARR